MPMSEEKIKQPIINAIPDSTVEIEDLKGDGDHYSARRGLSADLEAEVLPPEDAKVFTAAWILSGRTCEDDLHVLHHEPVGSRQVYRREVLHDGLGCRASTGGPAHR